MVRGTVLFFSTIGLGLLTPIGLLGQVTDYHDNDWHFHLELPPPWRILSPEELQQFNDNIRRVAPPPRIHIHTALQMGENPSRSFPLIAVQTIRFPPGGISREEIERNFARNAKVKIISQLNGKVTDLAKDVPIGSYIIDRSKNRIMTRAQKELAEIGRLKAVSVTFIGKQGLVSLHCWALQNDFEDRLADFEKILSSFRFDKGHSFTPLTETISRAQPDGWEPVWIGAIIAVIAVALAVGVGIIGTMFRNQRKQSPRVRG